MTIQPGTDIGRYHILEQLGEGGMAVVYKAYDTRLENDVAIKFIRMEEFGSAHAQKMLKRFQSEARNMAKLTHPNIVKVLDYGEFEGTPYLVMPYLQGGTLKEKLGRPMSWQEAVKILLPISDALAYAHTQGLIHRDIKPSNILITQSGQPMLSDFGVAKVLESEETLSLTTTGMGIGTPEYMAPEQWLNQVSNKTDIYALGVVLYELVTGKKPYTADTPAAVLLKQSNDPLPCPQQFNPDLPGGIEKVLFKALAKQPEDRYRNMTEMGAALENLLRSTTLSIGSKKPEQIVERTKETHAPKNKIEKINGGKSKTWIWAVGAIGIVLILFLVSFLSGNKDNQSVNTDSETQSAQPTTIAIDIGKDSSPAPASINQPAVNATPAKECKIAFVSNRDGNQEIYLMNSDGSSIQRLTNNPARDFSPSWSPNDSRIAFSSDRDTNWDIYLISADGTEEKRITNNTYDDFDPSWSPDGNMIAFTSYRDREFEIYTVDPVGKDEQRLTHHSGVDNEPDWSPDGSVIAFSSNRNDQTNNIYDLFLMNSEGSEVRNLTKGSHNDFNPQWSPDGNRIVFSTKRNGNGEIYVVNADGSGEKRLTNNPANDSSPSWSPDGAKIAFDSNRDGTNQIYIMYSDGLNVQRITNNAFDDWTPAWSPLCK